MENMTMLNTWINPTILAVCLVAGYAVKHLLPRVSNRLIPVTVVIVGIITALWTNQWGVLTPDILLSGARDCTSCSSSGSKGKRNNAEGRGALPRALNCFYSPGLEALSNRASTCAPGPFLSRADTSQAASSPTKKPGTIS